MTNALAEDPSGYSQFEGVLDAEAWFAAEGVPTLIRGYSFRTHVLPRVLPFLSSVGLAVLLFTILPSWATIGAVVLGAWVLRSLRHRERSAPAGRLATITMLFFSTAWPIYVPLFLIATAPPEYLDLVLSEDEGRAWNEFLEYSSPDKVDLLLEAGYAALYLLPIWLGVTAAALFLTWFGVVSACKRAAKTSGQSILNFVYLQGKALPATLFLTMFLFINEDIWQVGATLTPSRLAAGFLLFVTVVLLAAAARFREHQRETVDSRVGEHVLKPLQRFNIVVALMVRHLIHSISVGLGVFVFLVALGLALVKKELATRWIGGGGETLTWIGLPVGLIGAAGLLAGFAAIYFAVTSMTDPDYRHHFFAPTLTAHAGILDRFAEYGAARSQWKSHPKRD
jgi:hypothetical protein